MAESASPRIRRPLIGAAASSWRSAAGPEAIGPRASGEVSLGWGIGEHPAVAVKRMAVYFEGVAESVTG